MEAITCTRCNVAINADTGSCPSCGVDFSEPCPWCEQVGFHSDDCPDAEEQCSACGETLPRSELVEGAVEGALIEWLCPGCLAEVYPSKAGR